MTDNKTPDQTADDVEEITIGLPVGEPTPPNLAETFEINRYLLLGIGDILRDIVEYSRVDALIIDTARRLQSLLGGRAVEVRVHDPVGRLDGLMSERPELVEILRLTEDSYSIAAAFGESTLTRWLPAAQAAESGMFSGRGVHDDVLLILLAEQGQLVG